MAWFEVPIFYSLSLLDMGVLLCIGTLWSAALWLSVEGIKRRLRISKPMPLGIVWGPVAFSIASSLILFPVVLSGVGQTSAYTVPSVLVYSFVGAVGGLGTKLAHEVAGRTFSVLFDRFLTLLGGKGGKFG